MLHYPPSTRGGATCYLIKGAASSPPTKSTASWQIPLAGLSFLFPVWGAHAASDRQRPVKPGVQVRVIFSRSLNPGKDGSQRLCSPGVMMCWDDAIVGLLTLHQIHVQLLDTVDRISQTSKTSSQFRLIKCNLDLNQVEDGSTELKMYHLCTLADF